MIVLFLPARVYVKIIYRKGVRLRTISGRALGCASKADMFVILAPVFVE